MSVPGHSRWFRDVRHMSDLHPASDVFGANRHFAYGPEADVAEGTPESGSGREAAQFLGVGSKQTEGKWLNRKHKACEGTSRG
jgi:hypothetical protein